jgi:putative flippase GtrA
MLARSRSAASAGARQAEPAGSASAPTVRALLAHEAVGQLVRFAVAGAGVTLFAAGVYLLAAMRLGVAPLAANTISTACGVVVGYWIHSRWSFRAGDGDHAAQVAKFLICAGAAYALNSFWVWLAVHALGLPAWTPVTGMVFVTPLVSFAANRYWVFAR